ncbi:MAG: aminoacyl-tRNA deacylase [Sorangiineae bacterium NIC37A_2]|jgi:Cys-tRNA(Pro) deacylase|nr:MAG: aminoacyl-tRNA deacylase [Sorangiineae bacterium NIC37A_2]
MAKENIPTTPALLALRAAKVDFEIHTYPYVDKGGTKASSLALGVDEHMVVKTIVLETGEKKPLICLMHGDRQISTKKLARVLGVKTVSPCDPAVAERHTGYQVGGTSPFGTRKALPVYFEKSLLDLDAIYINGGARGVLVRIAPEVLERLLRATPVEVATE